MTFAFKDYSKRGGEYTILKNIRLKAGKVNFLEKRQVEILGKSYEASVFLVRSTVTVQTVESPVGGIFEDLTTEFELIVGEDKQDEIHDKLIEQVHARLVEMSDDDFIFDQPRMGVTYKNGSYLIFTGSFYLPDLVWSEGKFTQVKFIRYLNKTKGGLGSEQDFWENKIRFYPNGIKLLIKPMLRESKGEFLRLYEEGKFQRQ